MSVFANVDYVPYQTSKECQKKLIGVEAIDYFFARQIVSSQQSSNGLTLSKAEYSEMFHILIVLSYLQRQGSVCILLSKIANQAFWLELPINNDNIEHNLIGNNDSPASSFGYCFGDRMSLQQIVTKFIHELPYQAYLISENDRLYSKRYWQYEQNLCKFIGKNLSNEKVNRWQESINQSEIENKMKIMFNSAPIDNGAPDLQQLSVVNSLFSPFSIITGGAGTGKTYTIARLTLLLCEIRGIPASSIEMAAPTGKAANRLAQSLTNELLTLGKVSELSVSCKELSKIEPKTISRLLKINPATGTSAYNVERPLSASLVIVDETSMIDISLMDKLINSLSENTQLILVGDPNQLPSVETGCLLADLVSHSIGKMARTRWNKIVQVYPYFGLADNYVTSNIVSEQSSAKSAVNRLNIMRRSSSEVSAFAGAVLDANADKALSLAGLKSYGNATSLKDNTKNVSSLIQVKALSNEDPRQITSLKHLLSAEIIANFSSLFNADSVEDAFLAIQKYALLTPFRKTSYGSESLNLLIEGLLSQRYKWIEPGGLYKCKPIMILQNDYQLSLFNGDLGLIWEDEDRQRYAYFKTSKGLIKYPIYNLPAFDVNYAMTIHKTQGSEFEAIDIIVPNLNSDFLNRQLLYTGITRAKHKVRLFTDHSTLRKVINRSADRISGIESNLSQAIEEFN
jgi:exodeoxyribonuclease V alpha subunit